MGGSILGVVLYLVFLFGIMYLLLIKPQKKQQQKKDELTRSMEPGDTIMTTSGFYGTFLGFSDDTTVIVEFGNNKNCRIPMHKNAIAEVEKAGVGVESEEVEEAEESKDDKNVSKKLGKVKE